MLLGGIAMPLAAPSGQPARNEIERLLEEVRNGNQQAMGDLLEACRPYLLKIANEELPARIRPKCSPSDLVQKSLLKVHQNFERFKGDSRSRLLRWLRRILRNERINLEKHFRRRRRDVQREVPLQGCTDSSAMQLPLADSGPSPSGEVKEAESQERLRQRLNQALARMPEDQQRVIRLHQQENRRWEEIGTEMNRSADAVRKLWRRAVERLREEMGSEHDV